ncbi:MFS transporter permease [Vibrio parahaemolyticus]|nr:MFS transporter permease [Vibrio parahaemolyticus]MBM4851160.1 MFS transporter permease [Vibrio parahaemolyticus]HBC3955594.1 MFS transporter permease [Vibrio parahaemolyticus]
MDNSPLGRVLHPVFTGASFTYFMTMMDKGELISDTFVLMFATLFFAVALVLNGIFSFCYLVFGGEDFDEKVNDVWFFRRFSSLSQWSFIFAVVALLYYFIGPMMA